MRENKMTKHPGKQNDKTSGKTKLQNTRENKMKEHILFIIFTKKNVLSILDAKERKRN